MKRLTHLNPRGKWTAKCDYCIKGLKVQVKGDAIDKLAYYETLEQQGRLEIFPSADVYRDISILNRQQIKHILCKTIDALPEYIQITDIRMGHDMQQGESSLQIILCPDSKEKLSRFEFVNDVLDAVHIGMGWFTRKFLDELKSRSIQK